MRFGKAALLAALFTVTGAFAAAPPERTGEEIVKQQCSQCHAAGLHGAPRIDDRAAWVPRMKNGLDAAVRSAIKGHGAMPARGGMADLTDTELRSAVVYMFNPAGPPPKAAPPAVAGPNERIIDGVEIYLGVKPVSDGVFHVNITLRDAASHAFIGDARVEAKVANPVMGTETKALNRESIGKAVSYGNDFRMSGKESHAITVQVRRAQSSRVTEAKFEYRE